MPLAVTYLITILALLITGADVPIARAEYTQAGLGYSIGIGGSAADVARSVAYDSEGNVYMTGLFTGAVDFDPGAGTDNHTSIGDSDIFLTKIDADGTYAWTKTIGGSSTDEARAIAIDALDNVYIAGRFSATADFDPGPGTDNHTSGSSSDIFLTKINSDGSYGYTKSFESTSGSSSDSAHGVATDSNNNVYMTGEFANSVDFDPGVGTDIVASVDDTIDIFLTKINADGSYGWTKTMGDYSNDYGYALTLDDNDAVYVAGQFADTVDFNPGAGTDEKTSAGSTDAFVTKISSDGTYGWTNAIGGSGTEYARGVTSDGANNVYITGQFSGTVDFNPGAGTDEKTSAGSTDAFVTKISSDGTYGWTNAIGGSGSENGRSVTNDDAGNIYVSGPFSGTVDFNPSSGTDEKTSAGSTDIYVSKFKSDGSYDYTTTMGGTGSDDANSVSVDSANNVYLAGYFNGTVDFDPGTGTSNLTSAGVNDAFLTKLTQTTYQQITGLPPTLAAKTLSDTDATDNTIENGTSTTIRLSLSDTTPIADIETIFSSDLDWSTVTAESDAEAGKAFVHNLTAADGTGGSFTLYVPKLSGNDRVGICPGASSLAAVTDTCADLYYLIEGQDNNLTTTTIDGQDYWTISGLTGTGGFSTAADDAATNNTDTLADTGESVELLLVTAALLLIGSVIIRRNWTSEI